MTVADGCITDLDNEAWLKDRLAHDGWPKISKAGPEADKQAFLLVQHAADDPALQAQVLAELAKLAPIGETSPTNYAYLFDKIAMHRKAAQRYGSQGRCVGAGEWRHFDNEPGDLDARRTAIGLKPEAEFEAFMGRYCSSADGK